MLPWKRLTGNPCTTPILSYATYEFLGCRGWANAARGDFVRGAVLRYFGRDRQLLGVPHERRTHRPGGRRP